MLLAVRISSFDTLGKFGEHSSVKARLHRRFLSQQFNAIFVAPQLQLQNRTCKPLCDFGAILAIYRHGMRYNSRNTMTLSSSLAGTQLSFKQ